MKRQPINFSGERPRPNQAILAAWQQCRATAAPQNVSETDLILYGEIGYDWWTDGGITAETVSKFLAGLPNGTTEINVRINSPGGDVFEGVAIYNALLNSGLTINVKIDALAASIATVIAMAGHTVEMAGNGQYMIHKAWTIAAGNADDMRSTAGLLDSIDNGSIVATFEARTGLTEKEIIDMMAAETWMDAKTAKEKGFVDSVAALRGKPETPPDTTEADNKARAQAAAEQAAQLNTLRQKNDLRKRVAALAA